MTQGQELQEAWNQIHFLVEFTSIALAVIGLIVAAVALVNFYQVHQAVKKSVKKAESRLNRVIDEKIKETSEIIAAITKELAKAELEQRQVSEKMQSKTEIQDPHTKDEVNKLANASVSKNGTDKK